ncbi:alkaline phosphatase family protein [Brevibacillus sp. SYSU BS000544]|uniref:alkaline phosphatase family protein n=1 Tax=Brevibacillus sp. SYSU BS000544 TaxID=3416443 RepID=UPI003CE4AB76
MKKVIMFLIDAMMPDVLENSVAKGKTPALRFLMDKGQYIRDCVTVFPTMTASIDCSIITGEYPDKHKVPGLVWYDPDQKKIVNYFNGTTPVLTIGLGECAQNVLFRLNEHHLSKKVKTIHEELEEKGLTSGSINVIAHRGHQYYQPKLPFLMDFFTDFKMREKVSGPTILSLGKLIEPAIFRHPNWSLSQTVLESLGINDVYALDVLTEVIRSGKQPDFTFVYLPDNDHKLHKNPGQAETHLEDVDQQLARFLNLFDSWEQAVARNTIIVVSDHGHTLIGETEDHNILLEELLSPIHIHKLGGEVTDSDEIIICNNERMSFIYPLAVNLESKIVELLSSDSRIDLIAWKEGSSVKVKSGMTQKVLRFSKEGPYRDCYNQNWSIDGEWEVLDLSTALDGKIWFNTYPDALSRLYGCLFSQDIPMVVITAAPYYEFKTDVTPTHLGGGSHGSLHRQDSIVPLIVVGANQSFPTPARLVDLKKFIVQEVMSNVVLV